MKFLSTASALLAMTAAGDARLLASNDPRSIEQKNDHVITEVHNTPLEHTHSHVIRHLQSDARAYFPECEGLIPKTCIQILEDLCFSNPARFPLIETVGGCAALEAEVHFTRTRADNQYNRVVAVPDVTRTWAVGGRKDCLQHYELPWVVNGVSNDIGPWDCTAPAGQGDPEYGCMAVDDCCTLIRGSEPVDDLGNGLRRTGCEFPGIGELRTFCSVFIVSGGSEPQLMTESALGRLLGDLHDQQQIHKLATSYRYDTA